MVTLLVLAIVLARAEDKLPVLARDLTLVLFAITLTVFVVERMLAWRDERRWLPAKDWLYLILLERSTISSKNCFLPRSPKER